MHFSLGLEYAPYKPTRLKNRQHLTKKTTQETRRISKTEELLFRGCHQQIQKVAALTR